MLRRYLGTADYGPETLSVLFRAFDDAWEEVKSEVGELPDRIEAARSSLAQIILGLAASGTIHDDALQLKNIAVKAFRGSGSVGTLGKLN